METGFGSRSRRLSKTRQFADEVLKLVRGGMTVAEACRSDVRFPSAASIFQLCSTDPTYRAQFAEARGQRKAVVGEPWRRVHSEELYDAALETIRTKPGSLKAILVAPLPTYSAIFQRCEVDGAFKQRYLEAMKSHADPRLTNRATVEAALRAIEAAPKMAVTKVLETAGLSLRSRRTLDQILKRDESLGLLGAQIRAKRKGARKKQVRRKLVMKGNLTAALRADQMYALADRLVSKSLDPWDRDDVISELVVALLDGSAALDDAASAAGKVTRQMMAGLTRYKFASLDHHDLYGEGSWIERLSAHEWASA